MATQEDVLRTILEVQGQNQVEAANKTFQRQVEILTEVDAKYQAGAVSQRVMEQQQARTEVAAQGLIAAQGRLAATQAAAQGGFKLTGQAAQQLNFVMQDLVQGGISSTINNIPGLVSSFGGPAGLAAAVGGVGLAFVVLRPLLTKAAEYFADGEKTAGDFAGKVKLLEQHIKELTSKEFKLALDYHAIEDAERRLDRLREAKQAFGALESGKTEIQEKVSKGVKEALVEHAGGDDRESGAARVKGALIDDLVESGRAAGMVPGKAGAIDERRAEIGRLEETIKASPAGATAFERSEVARLKVEIGGLQAQIRAELGKEGGEVEQRMLPTDANRRALRERLAANPAAFTRHGVDPTLFGSALDEASPRAIAAREDEEYREQGAEETGKAIKEARRAARANEEKKAREEEKKKREAASRMKREVARIDHDSRPLEEQMEFEDHQAAEAGRKAERDREKAEREAEKAERQAPRVARDAAIRDLAPQIQQQYGGTDDQAMEAAKRAVDLMQKGHMPLARAAYQAVMSVNQDIMKMWGELDAMTRGLERVGGRQETRRHRAM